MQSSFGVGSFPHEALRAAIVERDSSGSGSTASLRRKRPFLVPRNGQRIGLLSIEAGSKRFNKKMDRPALFGAIGLLRIVLAESAIPFCASTGIYRRRKVSNIVINS